MTVVFVLGGAAFALLAFHFWEQLFEAEGPAGQRRFLAWSLKGCVVPIALWLIINCGLVPGMPILLPDVALARSRGGTWLGVLVENCAPVLFITISCWAAVTLGWLLTEIASRTNHRADFGRECLFWSAVLVPLPALVLYFTGPGGVGLAICTWLAPILQLTLPIAETSKPPPLYSRAVAKVKFGRYNDAEAEVLAQLETHEDDFEGWLMLADLYANRFGDLSEADRTVRELCRQPNTNPVQISIALHRLADWHLKLADDPASARSALEEISRLSPGTHFDRMARQRIDQLPATREELIEQRKPKIMRLPALSEDRPDPSSEARSGVDLLQAKAEAERCVERLKQQPNDADKRERFAILLAEQLGRAELAIEQLELLLAMPDPPTAKSAEWLAMIAAWQLKYQRNTVAGKKTLGRLMARYPGTPQAMAARRRIDLLETEAAAEQAVTASRSEPGPIKLVQP